ncbi:MULTISPECIES: polymorphic toxin type 44 domain-containing protein [unclassified Leifsonia]|uniref:polymorphic toxin type 44 domain-containing protein n=1 Tax=unclassified Leifsonia TaxID=2663824 RepID=UPI0008A75DF5|nr:MULTISPECIES: polymorphic toxin type 44 domain-containing protein [unclassified Leifsonia]SEI11169.1 LXG domain of WXG superfamily protein [Leifsonia sp. CL154]SFL89140.1 LXG domain of WXG superfamily protein [Leifsonia sp. CL147]
MGIRFGVADSSNLITAMRNNVATANAIIDRLTSGSLHLMAQLETGVLQGAAFTAGRGLFGELIIPGIFKLSQAVDDVQAELGSYEHAHSVLAEYGDLDHDELTQGLQDAREQLDLIDRQIKLVKDVYSEAFGLFGDAVNDMLSGTRALEDLRDQVEDAIRIIKIKTEKLEWFVSDVSNYFADSVQVMQLAVAAALELNKVAVEADGSYYTGGVNLAVFQSLRNAKVSTHAHPAGIPDGQVVYDTLQIDSSYSYIKLMEWLSSHASEKLRALALSDPGLFDAILRDGMNFKDGNPWGLLGTFAQFWNSWDNGAALGGGFVFLDKFATDGEWDMKRYLAREHGFTSTYFYLHDDRGRVVRSDVYGNVMYAFMLAHWGVSVETALRGANSKNTGVNAGITDDDLDDRAVKFGYELYKKYPNGMTEAQYFDELANAKLAE